MCSSDASPYLCGAGWFQTEERILDCHADRFGVVCITVFRPRPEESAQSVLVPARHHVDVQMGDALTDAIVHGNESSGRAERLFHRAAELLRVCEHWRQQLRRQLRKCLHVKLGDEQDVTGK